MVSASDNFGSGFCVGPSSFCQGWDDYGSLANLTNRAFVSGSDLRRFPHVHLSAVGMEA